MARREVGEINAGSMADIAFLLLIFFLVTTTMEVDAGIERQLPLKIDRPLDIDFPPVIERNVLQILANSKDELLVEGERLEIEDLQAEVERFYNINKNGERDKDMPLYTDVTIAVCETRIAEYQTALENKPDDTFLLTELEKWKTKLILCKKLPSNSYKEMSTSAVIRLENQAGTSYGLYIEIQNILKKVVNDLRIEACTEMGWGDYFELDEKNNEDDMEIIKMLRVLVPERIIEAKIEQ